MEVTPPTPVPLWLRRLYPRIGRLEANPLYIRLSGRGLGRRRWWVMLRSPPELRTRRYNVFQRVGCLPLLLMASPMAYLLIGSFSVMARSAAWRGSSYLMLASYAAALSGIVLLFVRLAGGGPRARLRVLLRNASAEPWGEGLYLSRLEPAEFDQAVFAALVGGAARRLGIFLVLCWIAAMLVFIWIRAAGRYGDLDAALLLTWGGHFALVGAVVFSEGVALWAMTLALGFVTVPHWARGGKLEVANEVVRIFAIVVIHVPGIVALGLWESLLVDPGVFSGWDSEWAYVHTFLLAAILPCLPFEIWVTRLALAEAEGNVGRALGALFERK